MQTPHLAIIHTRPAFIPRHGYGRWVLDLRDLAVPVLAAPMAGGPTTPELVSAVSEAGAAGFLAAGYKAADAVAADLAAVRAVTAAAFGVNLFVVAPYEADPAALEAYRRSLLPEALRLDVGLGDPRWDDDDYDAKIELVLDLQPDVASFTFGCPQPEVLRHLRERGVLSMVTVTSVTEGRVAVARGAASLCVQGPEAGGHRGTWDLEETPDTTPLLDLLRSVTAVVDVPVVAGGGLADAADVASVLARGAVAAQVGTAYLACDEAGTNPVHRAALADPAFAETTLTRAYTGRWARGLANRFTAEHRDAPAGYPQLHHLTAPLRRAAVLAGDGHIAHLWAGVAHAHTRPGRAADLTRALAP
jgi:nitronate monooxygenase